MRYTNNHIQQMVYMLNSQGLGIAADMFQAWHDERVALIPNRPVGDSRFETWFGSEWAPADKGTKQALREAYEEGMLDERLHPARPLWYFVATGGTVLPQVISCHTEEDIDSAVRVAMMGEPDAECLADDGADMVGPIVTNLLNAEHESLEDGDFYLVPVKPMDSGEQRRARKGRISELLAQARDNLKCFNMSTDAVDTLQVMLCGRGNVAIPADQVWATMARTIGQVNERTVRRGVHVMSEIIESLRESAVYVDEEGEDTTALESLLSVLRPLVKPLT